MVEGLWWVKMGEDESFSGEFPFDLPLQIKLDVYYLFLRFFWRLSFFQVFFTVILLMDKILHQLSLVVYPMIYDGF